MNPACQVCRQFEVSEEAMGLQAGWPFLLCLLEVLCFTVGALFVVFKYEGPRKLKNPDSEIPAGEDRPVGYLDRYELWDCCSGNLHPGWLCVFRAVAFFYLLSIQLYNLITSGPFVYLFYTQWTFTLLIIYFGLATCISVKELQFSKKDSIDEEAQALKDEAAEEATVLKQAGRMQKDKNSAGFLGYAMLVIFQVVAPAVLLTDTVYWLILVPFVLPSRYETSFVNFNMHAVNGVFLFGELFLNSMPFPWFRGGYFVFWSAVYLIFQWTIHAIGLVRWWPYPFLEVSTPSAPVWYFGLALVHLFCFLICIVLAKAKKPVLGYFSNT